MIRDSLIRAAILGLTVGVGCSGDYELERKGGPFPTTPVSDSGSGGSGNTSAAGAGGGAGEVEVGGGGAGAGAADLIRFCDALVVVRTKCQRCHGDPLANGAPVPFVAYEDFQAQYYDTEFKWWEIAVGMVERDKMPYVALNEPPTSLMPPVEPLTPDEKATLMGWLEQGALPEGGTDCP